MIGRIRIGLIACLLILSAGTLLAQYSLQPAGAPPSDLPAALGGVLAKDGAKIMSGGNVFCEIWFRATTPPAGKVEESATLAIVHGALLGVIRFPGAGSDRRGQPVKPGIYTLRYSTYPVNGDHQGVAPQRDFLVLSPIAIDTDLNATPGFEPLMDLSRKASGTPHPAVLGLWKAEPVSSPSLKKEGDTDWVLQTKIGDTPVAVIVIGKTEA